MANSCPPPNVKYFIAVLYKDSLALDNARDHFIQKWGSVDFEGKDHIFDMTDYYANEMGAPLYRRIISVKKLNVPTKLVSMKHDCNAIEDILCVEGKRTVNCDVGYLDHNKVILASLKAAGQKIYLDNGIYADLVGRYKSGRYQPFEWSFPDFKDGRYDSELLAIRSLCLSQVKDCFAP